MILEGNLKRSVALVTVLLMVSLGLSLAAVPPARATENYDLWTNSDTGSSGVADLYRWKQVDGTFCSTYGCSTTWNAWNGYGGQVSWQWMITRIPSTNPEADFYGVFLQFQVNPSYNRGNPGTYNNITLASYKNTGASVKMQLASTSQRVGTYLPLVTTGSTSASYGLSAGVSDKGGAPTVSVGFSTSRSYSTPDSSISPNQDANFGGFQSWSLGFGSSAATKMLTYSMTILVVTTEGSDLELDLTMAWSLSGLLDYVYSKYFDSFTWTKTLRLYFPRDVAIVAAAPIGCSAVVVTWTEYKGKYFSAYKIFSKPTSGTTWSLWQTITSSYVTGYGGGTFTKGVSYDFQVKWEVTVNGATYGRSTAIKSSLPGTSCSGGGCVAKSTPILTPNGYVAVEDLKKGDAVIGYDMAQGELVTLVLVSAQKSWQSNLIQINGGELLVTAVDQPIYADHAGAVGWVRDPQDLQVGDRIFSPVSGEWVIVTSVEPVQERIVVYDVVTSGPNTFIANGFLLDKKTY